MLLHGFPEHWWQWHAIAPVIAGRGYRVICPDLRGAGWTVADDPRIEREARLRDLLALFDALQIERAHVVSHDMGVITAMQLTYHYPERVRTAVQLSVPPGFFRFSPRIIPGFFHLPAFIWHRPGASLRGTFSERYVARPMPEATVEAHLAPMHCPDIDAAVRPLTRGMVLPEALRMMRGVYRRRRLTVPTLVVYGRRDHPWTEQTLGGSAATRSGTPIAWSSPTSTTQRTSSPTTHPPRSPTSRSTGSTGPRVSDRRAEAMEMSRGRVVAARHRVRVRLPPQPTCTSRPPPGTSSRPAGSTRTGSTDPRGGTGRIATAP